MKIYSDGFFSIDPTHGFLPIQEPLHTLPETYQALQELLDQMPIQIKQWCPWILASEGAFDKKHQPYPTIWRRLKKKQTLL
jgi:hypothetical protein